MSQSNACAGRIVADIKTAGHRLRRCESRPNRYSEERLMPHTTTGVV